MAVLSTLIKNRALMLRPLTSNIFVFRPTTTKRSGVSFTFKNVDFPNKAKLKQQLPPLNLNDQDERKHFKKPAPTRYSDLIQIPKSMPMPLKKKRATSEGADRVVKFALLFNCADMICKFGASYLTGSKSLFAEGVHSLMDTVNQIILYIGIKYSSRNADLNFPYGYGNARYVTSLISGCGILSFGCGLSIYHGVTGLLHPTELEPLTYAYYALAMSFFFQGNSLRIAFKEARKKANEEGTSLLNYVKSHADPSLNVVLLEDTAAATGVLIALGSITCSSLLESPIPDSVGSILIGTLLGAVATFIIRSNATHLVGRSSPKKTTDDIVCILENDPVIRSVHDVKATAVGVDKARFKAEIDFDGYVITQRYLREDDRLTHMFEEVKRIDDEAEFQKFMCMHGERIIDRIGDEIDRMEKKITSKHPEMSYIDLEAL
ncbi:Zinc transporter 9 domain protein [Aphelenchoides bicaudatus]|nr:Zinc transporter 9 domain protein [Aphelenchoides bicaudatus]